MEFLNSSGFVGTAVYFDGGRMLVFEGIADSFKVGVVNNIRYNKSSWGDYHILVPKEQVVSVEEKNRRDRNEIEILLLIRNENKNKSFYGKTTI